jgi:hypothetical protein
MEPINGNFDDRAQDILRDFYESSTLDDME